MFIRETLRRAFSSFLAIPTAVIIAFVLLAFGSYTLELADFAWLRPFRNVMEHHIFGDAQATSSLLGTIAAGIITVTSITFSLLLLALQQSAASMTSQVFDQFLQRRLNQLYFGFFVGIALFALLILATVNPPFNPVFGATLALLLTVVALYLLLLLIYSTISQMRPTEVIRAIHDHTLAARKRQQTLIQRTRRHTHFSTGIDLPVCVEQSGFFVALDLDVLKREIDTAAGTVEVVLRIPIGSYVAFQDTIASVRAEKRDDAERIVDAVRDAVLLQRRRQLADDPAYGIQQLETIAWRSISTSQQNPDPGIVVIQNLRDILARWSAEDDPGSGEERLPVVYPDVVVTRLLGAFESLAVVASESMQHQTYAEIVRAFALTLDRLPPHLQGECEHLLRRTLPALGDHVLTSELGDALAMLELAFERIGRMAIAVDIRAAHAELATTIGKLNSRATRVPGTA